MDEKVFVHLIPQCGMRIVKAIDILASAIVASKSQPVWQRRDGSIDYDKLPWQIKQHFRTGDFDDKGYINLDRIHIYHPETLYELSKSQVERSKANHCALPGKQCLKAYNYMTSVTTCAALAYRLAEGSSFDVRRHTFSDGKIPEVTIRTHAHKLGDSKEFLEYMFQPIWERARYLQQGYLSYLCSGISTIFSMIFCRSSNAAAA
ncbi:MAG: hypothetical protein KDK96_02365 [Chlamydiia bacterium]|nr:hypothetical protein [Chlamydiia bacterium]